MDSNKLIADTKTKFDQAVSHFQDDIKKIRTGRANPAMLDGIMVEVYGTAMPLNQTAGISAPEGQLLQITPYDVNNMQAIETAIRNDQTLGLNPADDGRVIRVPIPPLTEERRRDIVKQLKAKQEDCNIALRNARHDAKSALDRAKKTEGLGDDEAKRLEKQVDEAMKAAQSTAEEAAKTKEQEIMKV